MLAVLQGPGLSPDQLWGDLMGLAVHQLLSICHRVTLPWRVGTDSGVKSWRPVETCQISPVKTQRCGLRRCVFLRLDMRTLGGSHPFPGSSASKEENDPEKRMRKTGEEQKLILETCQEPQIISAGYSLLSGVTSQQQRLPWFYLDLLSSGMVSGWILGMGLQGLALPRNTYRATQGKPGAEVPRGHSLEVSSLH